MPTTREIIEGGCYHLNWRQLTVQQGLDFLKQRVLAEAGEQNIRLSNAEIAALTYSEPSATPSQRELMDQVDAEIGAEAYEKKIAKLIHEAYCSDLARGAKPDWDACLHALRNEDFYILVMVQEAGLGGKLAALGGNPAWYAGLLGPDTFFAAIVVIAGIAVLFTPVGSFLRSDAARGAVFVVWIATLWILGEWSRRRAFRKR